MPLSAEDKAEIAKLMAEQMPVALGAALPQYIDPLTQQVKKLEADTPGYTKRIVSDLLKDYTPPAPAADKDKNKPGSTSPEIQAELTRLAEENKKYQDAHLKLVTDLQTKDNEQAVRSALAKKPWVDIAEPLAELMPRVVKDAQGNFVVPTKQAIPGTDIVKDVNVPLAQAVDELAARKKHWLEFKQAGAGTGAAGSSGQQRDFSTKPTYEQLLANPTLMKDWSEHDPQYVATVAEDSIAKQRAAYRK